jgi:hypothetical protein
MSDPQRTWMTAKEIALSNEKRIDLIDAEIARLHRILQETTARLTALEERVQCDVSSLPVSTSRSAGRKAAT